MSSGKCRSFCSSVSLLHAPSEQSMSCFSTMIIYDVRCWGSTGRIFTGGRISPILKKLCYVNMWSCYEILPPRLTFSCLRSIIGSCHEICNAASYFTLTWFKCWCSGIIFPLNLPRISGHGWIPNLYTRMRLVVCAKHSAVGRNCNTMLYHPMFNTVPSLSCGVLKEYQWSWNFDSSNRSKMPLTPYVYSTADSMITV